MDVKLLFMRSLFSIQCIVFIITMQASPESSAQPSSLVTFNLVSDLVPGEVEVAVLLPPDYPETSKLYPLLLLLHGGGGSSSVLELQKNIIDAAWEAGKLPHVVVVTPSARDSLYMDFQDGSEKWETFIMEELLPELYQKYHIRSDAAGVVVSGISMGGTGALRLAFKYPTQFGAVAALSPAIAPVLSYDDVQPTDRLYRTEESDLKIYGNPVDREYWRLNHPTYIARENMKVLKKSGLQIYVETGDMDRFNLFRGAELLHRTLYDANLKHEYHVIRGGHHAPNSTRITNALEFLGRVLRNQI